MVIDRGRRGELEVDVCERGARKMVEKLNDSEFLEFIFRFSTFTGGANEELRS
jgi:hypothetical protein